MAGVLLLISKNEDPRGLKELSDRLQKFVQQTLAGYFRNVTNKNLAKRAFLIEFRNQDFQQFYQDSRGNWLTYEGAVFDLDSTIRYSARELFELYQKKNLEFPHHLDGHFVIKLYDCRAGLYLVCNDYIKNKTNYLVENEEFILFTPYLVTAGILLDVQLDLDAFNEFMWRYYILSDRTLLKGVQRLSAASVYSFNIESGKFSKERYWDWPHQYNDFSFKDTVEKTVSSMRETARLIERSFLKPCCDFTLGQDSRQVIAAFTNQKLPFATAIFGKEDFYEVRGVKKLAEKHHIENHNVQLNSDYLDDLYSHFKKAVLLGSCEQPGHLLSRILYMRSQYSKWGQVSLNGVDGHFYKNGLWDEQYTMNLYREPKAFNVDLFLKLRALSNNYNDAVFTDRFKKIKDNSRDYFRELIHESLKNYSESPVSMQVDQFDLHHWLNFGIAGNSATMSVIPHLSPLLLRRNLEFALTVPVQWKFNLSKYQRAVVYALDPQLAAEKTDFGGVDMLPKNLITYIPFYFRYFNFQTSRLRNKIKSKLGLKVITHLQEAWDYPPVYEKLFWNPEIQNILALDKILHSGILSEDKWFSYLNSFREQELKDLKALEFFLKIAAVELFLRLLKKAD